MSLAQPLRVVFDTNALVSALALRASAPRRALDYFFDCGRVLISLPLLGELSRVLHYPNLTNYITDEERAEFLSHLTVAGTLTTITVQLQGVRDPKDHFVLERVMN
jgi:putative PIN family toxin of toxin-antitoxin system